MTSAGSGVGFVGGLEGCVSSVCFNGKDPGLGIKMMYVLGVE